MNLKESFRYQSFLNSLMMNAGISISSKDHCFEVTKTHRKNKANPEDEDVVETVEADGFYPNDEVIKFMQWLISEKEKLSTAINRAKNSIDFDLDAAIETNKLRQSAYINMKRMTSFVPTKKIEQGRGYKFNVEGNQMGYVYDIEVESKDAFDRDASKGIMRDIISNANEVSSRIDSAMINTVVDYTPMYDVNDSFEDVMEAFTKGGEVNA